MTARLPSASGYALQVAKEHRWLPVLAGALPLPIPTPLALGRPGAGYPFAWSVYAWVPGEPATAGAIDDLPAFARALAGFLVALQRIDPSDGPPPGPHSAFRGAPLTTYDQDVQRALAVLGDRVDHRGATAVWRNALAASRPSLPVWFHGDVAVGNLLVRDGKLAGVIDFGCCGVGDPACDVTIAWTLLSGPSRQAFRAALDVDPATWARGRGWALWKALTTLAAHADSEPAKAADAGRVLDAVLAEHQRSR
jgi:aminoglycoside phosphotransferase (APT) family kinase protein